MKFRRQLSRSSQVGAIRRKSSTETPAVDSVLSPTASGADDTDQWRDGDDALESAGTNPLFKGGKGVEGTGYPGHDSDLAPDYTAAITTNGLQNARGSITDAEFHQVLEHDAPSSSSRGTISKKRVSANTTGVAVLGSTQDGGFKPEKEGMQNFMEHIKRQPRATYVPIECAKKILEEAASTAEDTRTQHEEVILTLDATYRKINKETKRHYVELIVRLQKEMRTELRRQAKETKKQEELAENLRDRIASQTANAAAQETKHGPERGRDRLEREKDAAEISASKAKLAEENIRALAYVATEARQATAAAVQGRVEDGRRQSLTQELENKDVHNAVSGVLADSVYTVEEQDFKRDHAALHAVLSTAKVEANQAKASLAEASLVTESLRAEVARLNDEGRHLRNEANVFKEELKGARQTQAEILEKGAGDKTGEKGISEGTAKREGVGSKQEGATWEDEDAEVLRVKLEKGEAAAMANDEDSSMALLELVRRKREAEETGAKIAALSRLLEEERTRSRRHERELASAGNVATDPEGGLEQMGKQTVLEEATVEKEARETEEAIAAAVEKEMALVTSTRRVDELEEKNASLMQNLLEAQQQARKAEQLASTGVVLPAAEMPGTTAVGAVGGDSDSYGDRVLTAAATTAVDTEKGPSPEAIRVEEIQAELKATAIAKKKVKAEIKEWIKEFEEREGRPPANEDKVAIKNRFVEHKRLEKTVMQLSSELQTFEDEIERKENLATVPVPTAPPTPTTPAGATGRGFGGTSPILADDARTGEGEQAALSTLSRELEAAKVAIEKGNMSVSIPTARREDSEDNIALFKIPSGELNETTIKMPSNLAQQSLSGEICNPAGELQKALQKLQGEHAAAAEEAKVKQQELQESLQNALKEVHEATLTTKKSEHLTEEASAALESTRAELASCQMVVDEASEAARLREQVVALKVDLEAKSQAATAGWNAAAGAESEVAAAEARGLQDGINRGKAAADQEVRSLKDALATATAALKKAPRSSLSKTVGDPETITDAAVMAGSTAAIPAADATPAADSAASGTGTIAAAAQELKIAERELDNLREREKDARWEANRTAEEIERFRDKLEQQRDREAELMTALAALDQEKETLSRGLTLAQERTAVALELAAAHTEEAAQARQKAALNAAKFRRVSRVAGQDLAVAAAMAAAEASVEATEGRKLSAGGRPSTTFGNRRAAEQLRLAAATLVHAVKEGTDLWRRQQKEECHALYAKAGARAAGQMPPGQTLDDLRVALTAAKGLNSGKAAVILRKAFDTVIEAAMAAKESLKIQRALTQGSGGSLGSKGTSRESTGSGVEVGSPKRMRTRVSSTSPNAAKSRNASLSTNGATKNASVDASATSATNEGVPGETGKDRGSNEGNGQTLAGENSKVASLRRQLELLTAKQDEGDSLVVLTRGGESGEGEGQRGSGGAKASMLESATRRCNELEDKVEDLEAECSNLREALEEGVAAEAEADSSLETPGPDTGGEASLTTNKESAARTRIDQAKIKSLERSSKGEAAKAKKLQAQVTKLESALASANTSLSGKSAAEAKEVKTTENKLKKAVEDFEEKSHKHGVELTTVLEGLEACKTELAETKKEREDLRKQVSMMGSMSEEMQTLQTRADEATRLESEIEEAKVNASHVEGLYQAEQVLRKKYWNMMEDMKGKIRVFARCRPFAQYELDQGCKRAVRIADEATIEVDGLRGPKQFVFDSVFSEQNSQKDIFEDTRNLVQSALDGFNVCVFAYGQTGSGKTWTMTGGKGDQRGLTPRVIEEIFGNIEKSKGAMKVKVSCYFIELYLDNLRDLLFAMHHPRDNPPKLEVHLDANKMVVVKNVVIKGAENEQDLLNLFNQGNLQRKVGGTKMNAESSRSHSVFSVLLEVYNATTKATTTGKLSLVDLAGSERADKTGATADRLKEAQSINKSLSALGDVISALSTNEKFIPYRNNKLTQVMQDSLGGNAKTLMFANISPADYNQDETVTSLTYATRVKLITNTAEKHQDGEEVSRLKETIRKLKAGENVDNGGEEH